MYDYVIITHIPAFYKVNLYNALAKKLNVYVIFIAANTREKRAEDFAMLHETNFKYDILFDGNFQDREIKKTLFKLRNILKTLQYQKLLVSGWDLKEFWYLVFFNPKAKNCLALESTILESNIKGIKRFLKKIFLSRIATVFASGSLHEKLLIALHYRGMIQITHGVGIINKPEFEKSMRTYQKRFLYIGRLSYVKNLKFLIEIFNTLPEYTLTIIGEGEEKEALQRVSKSNIVFRDPIANSALKETFLEEDILILPSIIEPWGLVVEEALYFGVPIIVSRHCGVSELIENGVNGYVIHPADVPSLRNIILQIDAEVYNHLVTGVNMFSIDKKDTMQIESYL
ncbi:MAG: glycosyltransferase family 4 protein [Sulfurospirillaceae bacterium]|nr:glycosyltransferase family 4 protein [Sulfurospirillaceae bacterium]